MRIATFTANASLDVTLAVDGFTVGGVFQARAALAMPGGKGLNVARFARAMGAQVVATGFVAGFTGKRILEGLARLGIENDFISIPGESRMCLVILDEAGGSETEIREAGPEVPERAVEAAKQRMAWIAERADAVVMSGSLPPGCPATLYRELVGIVRERGARAIVDTSGESLREALAAAPDLVKPNQKEFEALTGRPVPETVLQDRPEALPPGGDDLDELYRVVDGWRRSGVGTVVLSLGGAGAVVFGERVLRVWPPQVRVRSTVSCGDALVAGFTLGLSAGRSLEEAARLATAMAAAAALQLGTGVLDPADVSRLFPLVTVADRTPPWWHLHGVR